MKRVISSSVSRFDCKEIIESIADSIEECTRKYIKDFDTAFKLGLGDTSLSLTYSEGRVPRVPIFECFLNTKSVNTYFYIDDITKPVMREFRKWIVSHSSSNKKFRTTWKILHKDMVGVTYQGTYGQALNSGVLSLVRVNTDLVDPYDIAEAQNIKSDVTIKVANGPYVVEVEDNPNYESQLKELEPKQETLF